MKKTIYTLCAGVFALLTIIGCSKSDDNNGEEKKQVKTSNFNIPAEAKAIIPEKFIGEMAANGMTINEGTNPPNIEGIFATGMLELTYISSEDNGYPIGKQIEGYRYKFYNQKGTKLKADYVHESLLSDDRASGKGVIISGSGNKFTAYLRVNGSTSLATYKMAIVISGEISSEGGKDFKLGICMIEKDDPTKDLMDIGAIRVWVDQDKFAPRKQKYPYGD